MSRKHYFIGGDGKMKEKKKWYDYLWIVSLTYLILGFFNILFAWLGLLCFFIPLIIAIAKGNKALLQQILRQRTAVFLNRRKIRFITEKDIPAG